MARGKGQGGGFSLTCAVAGQASSGAVSLTLITLDWHTASLLTGLAVVLLPRGSTGPDLQSAAAGEGHAQLSYLPQVMGVGEQLSHAHILQLACPHLTSTPINRVQWAFSF